MLQKAFSLDTPFSLFHFSNNFTSLSFHLSSAIVKIGLREILAIVRVSDTAIGFKGFGLRVLGLIRYLFGDLAVSRLRQVRLSGTTRSSDLTSCDFIKD